mmetsp:Transcript_6659/g.30084  ORF Transcript_6659/g.30084 Transcript_6659/m.30084 type:complete len:211 (-) Transcript_6659:636-1268(-)
MSVKNTGAHLRPTALDRPRRQNVAERTIFRRKSFRNGASAYTATTVENRPSAPHNAVINDTGLGLGFRLGLTPSRGGIRAGATSTTSSTSPAPAATAAAIPPMECPITTRRGLGKGDCGTVRCSMDWYATLATSSIARDIAPFVFGRYLERSVGRAVRPKPGESCATTAAPSASASGDMAHRSHEYVLAPKPWQHETTTRGGPFFGRRSL